MNYNYKGNKNEMLLIIAQTNKQGTLNFLIDH